MENPHQNISWTEKYRPKTFDEIVGDSKNIIKNYIDKNQASHFLLHSRKPGTGKTTTGFVIARHLGCRVLIINASDDRNVDVIRTRVKHFVNTKSMDGKKKMVFLDEVDGMTKVSQESLRNLMEQSEKNAFFVLTCNKIHAVIEPLQSRCTIVEFSSPKKEQVKEHLIKIIKEEGMEYDDDGVDAILELHFPSIRDCVIKLQNLSVLEKGVFRKNIKDNTISNDFMNVLEIFKKVDDIEKLIEAVRMFSNSKMNPIEFNRNLFDYFLGLEKSKTKEGVHLLEEIAEASAKLNQSGFENDIIYGGCLFKILPKLKKLMVN